MGRAGLGRPKTPTNLAVLRGQRSDRVNTDEPIPDAAPVEAPEGLSPEALAVWDRLAPELERKGVLTPWDVDAFAVFCHAVAVHRGASAVIDADGPTGVNRFDERVVSPWFRVWADSAGVLARFGARFGLSPADRASIVVGGKEKPSSKERLLSG